MTRQLENTVRKANFLVPKKFKPEVKRIKIHVPEVEAFPKPRDALHYSKTPSKTDSVVKSLLKTARHSEVVLDPINRNM